MSKKPKHATTSVAAGNLPAPVGVRLRLRRMDLVRPESEKPGSKAPLHRRI
jgi:hypothetical protein